MQAAHPQCPKCSGSQYSVVLPGRVRCTSEVLETKYVRSRDVGAEIVTGTPRYRDDPVVTKSTCGNEYTVAVQTSNDLCLGRRARAACGAFAVGRCANCDNPVCSEHVNRISGMLVCRHSWPSGRLESGDSGLALSTDITDADAIGAARDAVIERFGRVDLVVNNAALVSETLFPPTGHRNTLDTADSDWELMFGVNVFGTLKVIRAFAEPMRSAGRGSIVNVVSSGVLPVSTGGGYHGLRPWTVEMPYQATKAAVMALTFYLAEEVRREGLAVNAIMPGHTRASWFDATARAFNEQGMAYFMRPAVPEHLLPISLFLAAQDGSGATGRLYYVPDWNYDHGYGDYATWQDHELPPDMEEAYRRLEAATPAYDRAGVAHLPFDAQGALYTAGVTNLGAQGNWASTESAQ